MQTVEVKQYVDVIGDAINGLKAKRNAAEHLNCDQSVIDEMDRQIREYSAMKLQAQMELGKRTAEMEKNITGRGDKVFHSVEDFKPTKSNQLSTLGIAPQRANDFEKMHKNKDVVNQYIEESLEKGKAPSRNGALNEIKKQEAYIKESDVNPKKGKSKVDRKKAAERDANIEAAIFSLKGAGESTQYGIEELIADIAANGENAVSTLRMFLSQWAWLFQTDDSKKEVSKAIDDFYYRNIIYLKGEFNL